MGSNADPSKSGQPYWSFFAHIYSRIRNEEDDAFLTTYLLESVLQRSFESDKHILNQLPIAAEWKESFP